MMYDVHPHISLQQRQRLETPKNAQFLAAKMQFRSGTQQIAQ